MDETDLRILDALERLGAKVSTLELSKKLEMNDRTVRYRLEKLREREILFPPRVITHELKLGLGEMILVVNAVPDRVDDLEEVIRQSPCFYWYDHTVGGYNGFIMHMMYPTTSRTAATKLMKEMKKQGLITDYYLLDIVDYGHKQVEYERYIPKEGWEIDWEKWVKKVRRNLSAKRKIKIELEHKPQEVEFDGKDILILKYMLTEKKLSVKELASLLPLSEAQTHKRIKRLEKVGIIKGYRSVVGEFGDHIYLAIFMEIEGDPAQVLSSFTDLPFSITIAMESTNKYLLRLGISAKDYSCFLEGFSLLRHRLTFYLVQIEYNWTKAKHASVYETFNFDDKRWELPFEDTLEIIRSF